MNSDAVATGSPTEWYEELRRRYRPARLRILLIGESPPDPGLGERRFFYSPVLTYDNLYRGVVEALYGDRRGFDIHDKVGNLRRLQEDGLWLTPRSIRSTRRRLQLAAGRLGNPSLDCLIVSGG